MMNSLILFLLFLTSNVMTKNLFDFKLAHSYKEIPESCYRNDACLQSALIWASWAAKYDVYDFEECVCGNALVFIAYNDQATFILRFDKLTHQCDIEFSANDNSFSYDNFKSAMDSYFLYNN